MDVFCPLQNVCEIAPTPSQNKQICKQGSISSDLSRMKAPLQSVHSHCAQVRHLSWTDWQNARCFESMNRFVHWTKLNCSWNLDKFLDALCTDTNLLAAVQDSASAAMCQCPTTGLQMRLKIEPIRKQTQIRVSWLSSAVFSIWYWCFGCWNLKTCLHFAETKVGHCCGWVKARTNETGSQIWPPNPTVSEGWGGWF